MLESLWQGLQMSTYSVGVWNDALPALIAHVCAHPAAFRLEDQSVHESMRRTLFVKAAASLV